MPGLDLGEEGTEKEREKDQGALRVPELESHRERVPAGLAEGRRQNLDDPEGKRDLRNLAENIALGGGAVSSRNVVSDHGGRHHGNGNINCNHQPARMTAVRL